MSEVIYLTDVVLITCVVDKGRSEAAMIAARDLGAPMSIVHTGHGWGTRERLGVWGVAVETDRDVIVFLVPSDQQDLVFEAVYKAADMDAVGRGFMFVSPVDKAATYVPEALRKRLGLDPE